MDSMYRVSASRANRIKSFLVFGYWPEKYVVDTFLKYLRGAHCQPARVSTTTEATTTATTTTVATTTTAMPSSVAQLIFLGKTPEFLAIL